MEEVEGAAGAEGETPDRERDQGLEVPEEEPDGEVRGRDGAKGGDEGLTGDAVRGRIIGADAAASISSGSTE